MEKKRLLFYLISIFTCNNILFAAENKTSPILPIKDYSGPITERSTLTGDWFGLRNKLADKGITMDLYSTSVWQNLNGSGVSQESAFGTSYNMLLNIDLQRIGWIKGGYLTMRVEADRGNSVNSSTGNWATMSPNYNALMPLTDVPGNDDNTFELTNFYYTQFFNETTGGFIGRFDNNHGSYFQEFAGSGSQIGHRGFMNFSFASNPVVPNFIPYVSALGGGIFHRFSDYTNIVLVIQDINESSQNSSLDKIGENGWNGAFSLYHQYKLNEKPGGFMIGAMYSWDASMNDYSSQSFDAGPLQEAKAKDSGGLLVFNIWQYVKVLDNYILNSPLDISGGTPNLRGYGLFLQGAFGNNDVSLQKHNLSAGVVGKGIHSSRPNDVLGVGFYYNKLNTSRIYTTINDIQIGEETRDRQYGIEIFYDIEIYPWLHISPDFQYNVTESKNGDNSYIFGIRTSIEY